MKAYIPDEILINRGEDGRLHHSYWTTDQELVPFEDTLYIRKNALIEWVEEQLAILDKQTLLHPDDDVFRGQRNAYKQMKDTLFEKSWIE